MKKSTVVGAAATIGIAAYAASKMSKFHQTKITCIFNSNPDKIYYCLRDAILKSNYQILEENYKNKAILFKTGLSMSSMGQEVIAGITNLSAETKKCPDCAEEIKIEAKKCRYCGKLFKIEENINQKIGVGCIARSGQMYDWDEKEFITYNVMKNLNNLLDPEERDDEVMIEAKQFIDSVRNKQIIIKFLLFGFLAFIWARYIF